MDCRQHFKCVVESITEFYSFIMVIKYSKEIENHKYPVKIFKESRLKHIVEHVQELFIQIFVYLTYL